MKEAKFNFIGVPHPHSCICPLCESPSMTEMLEAAYRFAATLSADDPPKQSDGTSPSSTVATKE